MEIEAGLIAEKLMAYASSSLAHGRLSSSEVATVAKNAANGEHAQLARGEGHYSICGGLHRDFVFFIQSD